jgi:hypothetical protein
LKKLLDFSSNTAGFPEKKTLAAKNAGNILNRPLFPPFERIFFIYLPGHCKQNLQKTDVDAII